MLDLTFVKGAIDIHVHSGPDLFQRVCDDIDLTRCAQKAGMRALVLKCHFSMTPFRAAIAKKVTAGDLEVFGGVVLNKFVGGLNPYAVDAALIAGAKIVWMPTIHAQNHLEFYGFAGYHTQQVAGGLLHLNKGITILNGKDELIPEMEGILNLIAEKDVILATGHCSVHEIMFLVKEAKEYGIKKIIINHPEFGVSRISVEKQVELAREGAFLERTFLPLTEEWGGMKADLMVDIMKKVGVQSSILATDLGQIHNPSPVEGYGMFIQTLLEKGITPQQVRTMSSENPRKLLGLEEST